MVSEARFVVLYLFVIFTALATSFRTAIASPKGHRYNVGDDIPLFVNKVGSMYNPSETYPYYDFPFCRSDPVIEKKRTLMEVLNGDILTNSLYVLKFRDNKKFERLCEKKLTKDEVAKFRDAVSNDFYLQMYYDDLPLWLGFGDTEEDEDWFHRMLATLLLWNLRDDIIKSSMVNEEGMKEVGRKYTHGDAFSYPPYTSLLCAVLGTGTQLLTLFFFVFLLVLLGVLYP